MSYIKINQDKCKSCYLCMDVCPKKLIQKSDLTGINGEYVVEFVDKSNECLACGQCATVCPDMAIEEVFKS